jgi:hypothetical protein
MKSWTVIIATTLGIVWLMSSNVQQFVARILLIVGVLTAIMGVLFYFVFYHRSPCPRCRRRGLRLVGGEIGGHAYYACSRCRVCLVRLSDGWRDATAEERARFVHHE